MKKVSVAFLWHMHQPMYKDLRTGEYLLPWVRLHSTYSYLDMAAILDSFPDVRCTFNITPVLMWQLLDLSSDEPVKDKYLQLTEKHPQDLTDEEKCFILMNFFSCDRNMAIAPVKRYMHLLEKRGDDLSEEALLKRTKTFAERDFRDLQVHFNLAWCGFTLRDKNAVVRKLLHKGESFTEEEKATLLDVQKEVVGSILPRYKKLQDEGRVEISTTPFYHPILPLICGRTSAGGYDLTEDAMVHVGKAIDLYKKVFGRPPRGMWPSEGSVSQETIPLFTDAGIKWIATDEGIVLESFRSEDTSREDLVYNAFTAGKDGNDIDMVFRDINLSNALSFRYATMPSKRAAVDLHNYVKNVTSSSDTSGECIVSIILDGENPWPYYRDGGKRFLSEMYKCLSADKGIELVTIGGYLASHAGRKKIEKLHAGSWINRDFSKWIGSPQKNRAWELLEETRKELFASGEPNSDALEELYIAEGSDWFWWYDDFGAELNYAFDEVYRTHLMNVYMLMGREVPPKLLEPIQDAVPAQKLPEFFAPGEMARMPKILFVSSEVVPFAKTGGLADVSGSLPEALSSLGCDVRVIMPLYKCVRDAEFDLTKEADHVEDPVVNRPSGFDLYSIRIRAVTTYFLGNKKYFSREGLYGTSHGDYHDNALRFGNFSKAALGALKAMDFKPDIIHCNDWQSALIPFYLRFRINHDTFYRGIKTLFTIHNMAYQGLFSRKVMKKLDIPARFFNMSDMEFHGKLSFMKSGILYSDAVSTVSRHYAEEMMTPEYGAGLDGLLKSRRHALYGILNGVDYSVWSPKNDKFIKERFDAATIDKKDECRKDLIEYTHLKVSEGAPLIGCVTRLAEQKGMDLVSGVMGDIIALGAGVVILGRGSDKYNRMFRSLKKKYPGKIYVCSDFNDELAHKIEAGSDMFLMPSRYEPCGLNQMYSIKYGTIPIVRATGGLDDVIVDYDENREKSNGFKFAPATQEALLNSIKRAVSLYQDKGLWKDLMMRAMEYDFSWEKSAGEYLKLYKKILSS